MNKNLVQVIRKDNELLTFHDGDDLYGSRVGWVEEEKWNSPTKKVKVIENIIRMSPTALFDRNCLTLVPPTPIPANY